MLNRQIYFRCEQLFEEVEYPERYEAKNLWKTVSIQFGVIFTFLILYKPFGVYEPELKFNYFLICGLHAFSPSLIVYIYFRLLNYYRVKRGPQQKWTLFNECRHLSTLFFMIGTASFLMRDLIYNNALNWSLRYFWEEIRNCYLAGGLFYFYLLFAKVYFKSKAKPQQMQANPIIAQNGIKGTATTAVFIDTQVKQDNFSFDPNELLFVKAEGNYVELTTFRNQQLTTELKRISLRQLELRLTGYPFLFRCHRAYLVNLLQIEKVSGNSQGYLVSFQLPTDKIPVSRALLDSFDERYKQIQRAFIS